MQFNKEDLQDLLWDEEVDRFKIIDNEITGTSRWSINHRLVFSFEDKFYETHYSVGATEYQEERPFEYEGPLIECTEVFPVTKTITVYQPNKGN